MSAPDAASGRGPSSLSRDSEQPLYLQLAARLAREIDAGRLAVGDRLPSETELMAMYGVSRVTVRQAIGVLAREGRVSARRGKGTFVTAPRVRHDLGELRGFYDALRAQGLDPETELLAFEPAVAAADAGRPAGVDLPVRLRRRYVVSGTPFALVEAWLPAGAAGLGRDAAARLTAYQIVERYLGLRIAKADLVIRCQRASSEVARALKVARGQMMLVLERRSAAPSGQVCEFMRIHILPERYEFCLSVAGPVEIARAVRKTVQRVGSA